MLGGKFGAWCRVAGAMPQHQDTRSEAPHPAPSTEHEAPAAYGILPFVFVLTFQTALFAVM